MSSTGKDTRLDQFVGRYGAPMPAPDPVNSAMIHHWRQAMGDANRAYWDSGFAGRSRFGQVIAPPAMTQVWTMPPLGLPPAADAVGELYDRLDYLGYTSIVATNSAQTYLRPQYLGDSLTATKHIASISEEKSTRIGTGRFVTTEIDIVDSGQHTVATQLHRVLKFRPAAEDAAGGSRRAGAAAPARRPRPNVTADTEFYFQAARQGALLIQRCEVCGYLQHPPWPSCQNCHADRLQPTRMSGRGELYSFTVVHAPVVEPFRAPYLVALVALDEGPRVVAGLIGVQPDEARIGLRLQAEFARFDEELTLPVFRPSTSRDTSGAGVPDQTFRTIMPKEVSVGMKLPELSVPISPTFIVAGALASRDFQPVHHDPGYAAQRGMPAVFTNIMTTQGLVSRFITDWTGPEALLQNLDLRLGTSNFPDDVLTLAGRVAQVRDDPGQAGSLVTVDITGENGHGTHVTGSVMFSLLEQAA